MGLRQMTDVREVRIPCGEARLYGDLALPQDMKGLVLFAHGSGSGRHSARNRQVANALQQAGIGTLLFDLLTVEEERDDVNSGKHRFDIALLTQRMQDATAWVRKQPELRQVPVGYFGASTGSAAALIAAARLGDEISAVVSRGGRPDLAGSVALAAVTAPTLLLVGGADLPVIEFNERALRYLRCTRQLTVIPLATHLFEEPGALEQVSQLAAAWFVEHLNERTHAGKGHPMESLELRHPAGLLASAHADSSPDQPPIKKPGGKPQGAEPTPEPE